jgi:four helix bundle protein
MIKSFEDLECWKTAREIRILIGLVIKGIPQKEFDMIDNMKRAARSCTRNIAEGYGRYHYQENIQFCRISRGSMYELKDDLITCLDEKFIADVDYKKAIDLLVKGITILNGYINYLERAKQGTKIKNVTKDLIAD